MTPAGLSTPDDTAVSRLFPRYAEVHAIRLTAVVRPDRLTGIPPYRPPAFPPYRFPPSGTLFALPARPKSPVHRSPFTR